MNRVVEGITIDPLSSYELYIDLHNIHGNVELFVKGTLATTSGTTGLFVTAFSGGGPADPASEFFSVHYKESQPASTIFGSSGTSEDVSFTPSSGTAQTKVSNLSIIRKEMGDWMKLVITNKDTSVTMTDVSIHGVFL